MTDTTPTTPERRISLRAKLSARLGATKTVDGISRYDEPALTINYDAIRPAGR